MFSALVKLLVRELRTTERTNVIVLYLGGVSTLGAAAACAVLPGGFVVPTRVPQYSYLLGAGPFPTTSVASPQCQCGGWRNRFLLVNFIATLPSACGLPRSIRRILQRYLALQAGHDTPRRPVWVRISGHDDDGPPPCEGCASHSDVLLQRCLVRTYMRCMMADAHSTLSETSDHCSMFVGLHGRGMIAGEVLFHEQPTLLSMVGAVMICCSTLGVTLFENHTQQPPELPPKQAAMDTELGSTVDTSEKRPLMGF